MKRLREWTSKGSCALPAMALLAGMAGAGWSQTSLPEGKGKDIVEATCSACHGLNYITDSRKSKEDWRFIVRDMVDRGALLADEEIGIVVEYLAEHFGPAKTAEGSGSGKTSVNKATAKERVIAFRAFGAFGLAEKQAEAVVQHREKNADFAAREDLKKVSGLDSRKIEAKKDHLQF